MRTVLHKWVCLFCIKNKCADYANKREADSAEMRKIFCAGLTLHTGKDLRKIQNI